MVKRKYNDLSIHERMWTEKNTAGTRKLVGEDI